MTLNLGLRGEFFSQFLRTHPRQHVFVDFIHCREIGFGELVKVLDSGTVVLPDGCYLVFVITEMCAPTLWCYLGAG